MKKKTVLKFALLACSTLALAGCKFEYKFIVPAYPFDDTLPDNDPDGGTYSLKVWCDKSIVDLTRTQIKDFETLNQGKYTLNITVEPESEGDAATDMLQDVQAGADIYCFAQDQLSRLKIAGALAPITGAPAKEVRKENPKSACNAASYNGELYSFPMTSDNGYFMYYDKSVIPEDHVGNMNAIIEDCKRAGKKMNYGVFANGFYSASYFMATGCYSNWTIDNATGNFTGFDDTYSQYATPALKALRELKKADIVAANDQTNKLGTTAAVAISGIWNYAAAEKALGANLGCAQMPSFTVDGEKYHISSFSGYKLIGYKPQKDAKKASVCRKIAQYLTSEKCQLERFNSVGWGPSNTVASQNERVLAQPGLKALNDQAPYAKEQVICPGSWWSNVSTLAGSVKGDTKDSEFTTFLSIYDSNLPGLLDDQEVTYARNYWFRLP